MSKKYTVIFANSALFSIDSQIHHLAGHVPTEQTEEAAYARIKPLVDGVLDTLSDYPLSYPVAPELLELGITRFRRMLVDSYRVFYAVDENASTVTLVLFIHQRQSVQRALQDYAILAYEP